MGYAPFLIVAFLAMVVLDLLEDEKPKPEPAPEPAPKPKPKPAPEPKPEPDVELTKGESDGIA